MKTQFKFALFLALFLGICGSIVSPTWAQLSESFTDAVSPDAFGPNVVGTFSFEDNQPVYDVPANNAPEVDEITSAHAAECQDCQSYQGDVATDENFPAEVEHEHFWPEVKNVNFFGVDPDDCCDEWAGMNDCKSPKYNYACGGLKSSRGHLGIFWLKRKYGGDGCDYCNGGCCEKKCGSRLKALCGCKDSDEEEAADRDEASQATIFGRPLESNCRRCGGCDEGCPPKKGCTSCK